MLLIMLMIQNLCKMCVNITPSMSICTLAWIFFLFHFNTHNSFYVYTQHFNVYVWHVSFYVTVKIGLLTATSFSHVSSPPYYYFRVLGWGWGVKGRVLCVFHNKSPFILSGHPSLITFRHNNLEAGRRG